MLPVVPLFFLAFVDRHQKQMKFPERTHSSS
ncbi:MAG: hypothetical protein AW07_03726 [Candidatus Accumulibacter sp. SK-11]|nr:MAG: hypothetical protein AW07_03726 [Candidatus Accumulibacter sp. SK-11]